MIFGAGKRAVRRDKGAAGGIGIRQWRLMPGRKKVVQGEKEGDEEDDRACTDNTGHLACRVLMSSYLGMVAVVRKRCIPRYFAFTFRRDWFRA